MLKLYKRLLTTVNVIRYNPTHRATLLCSLLLLALIPILKTLAGVSLRLSVVTGLSAILVCINYIATTEMQHLKNKLHKKIKPQQIASGIKNAIYSLHTTLQSYKYAQLVALNILLISLTANLLYPTTLGLTITLLAGITSLVSIFWSPVRNSTNQNSTSLTVQRLRALHSFKEKVTAKLFNFNRGIIRLFNAPMRIIFGMPNNEPQEPNITTHRHPDKIKIPAKFRAIINDHKDLDSGQLCPINGTFMTQPVKLPTTPEVVDITALEAWFATGNYTCPFTRRPLDLTCVEPCHDTYNKNQAFINMLENSIATKHNENCCPNKPPMTLNATSASSLSLPSQILSVGTSNTQIEQDLSPTHESNQEHYKL
ncbi:MAG: U-box domain-containing protein [Pseudomonadota bacterium]|nr:U-box domain-containing protein [Pseudomonadota bacterium]